MVRGDLFCCAFFLSFLKVGIWGVCFVYFYLFAQISQPTGHCQFWPKNVCINKQVSVDKGILDMN